MLWDHIGKLPIIFIIIIISLSLSSSTSSFPPTLEIDRLRLHSAVFLTISVDYLFIVFVVTYLLVLVLVR